jgi:cytochrome c-type biogenesis protein CcmE
MKPKSLFGLVAMIGFAALLLLNFGSQVGGYMDFESAEASGSQAHVVGMWIAEEAMSYDRDRNVFSFTMEDEQGNVRRVEYRNPKPANFEDAERLVIEGRSRGDVFEATHILVKCPSKYNDERALQQMQQTAH